ncbi:MAG: hypothetical protein SNJ70_07005 [Armatimonadota bacterium]
MSDSTTKIKKTDIVKEATQRYIADNLYQMLLGEPQAMKLRQISKEFEIENVTPKLLKHIMVTSEKFASVDRRWAVKERFGDKNRPFERILNDLIINLGHTSEIAPLASELAVIYNRYAEYYEDGLIRFFSDKEKYFKTEKGTYGTTSWLFIPTSDDEEDVIFDNAISARQLEEYKEICPEVKWDMDSIADSAAEMLEGAGIPIPIKIMAYFAWKQIGDDFDPVLFYEEIENDDRFFILSDTKVYPSSLLNDIKKQIPKLAEEAESIVDDAEDEDEGPIEVSPSDIDEAINIILDKGTASTQELLETILEVTPEENAYAEAAAKMEDMLREDERVTWLGTTLWGKVVVFPEEVKVIPESLLIPECPPFETPEGDIYDQELEIDGLEGNLKAEIYDPLAEDVTDEDPNLTNYQPNGDSQRCVLKYHHKTAGTFPLCQINPDFFGTEPEIIPLVFKNEGKRKEVYVNNSTRLIYGLSDFYSDITEISGSVFIIEKTPKAGEFNIHFETEHDDQLHIDTNRSLELLDLKARYESEEMPVYDVIKEILISSKQGMTFPRLVNEVNVVRRCSRLLVASILSSYHCFHTRGKSNIWQFDEKKESQGFNKTKKKHIKKIEE